MAYGLIYRLEWPMTVGESETNVTVTLNIYDTEVIIPDGDEPQVISLIPAASPFTVSTVNNGREKWGIFSKQAKIRFLNSDLVNAYTFADAKDDRFYVEAVTDEPQTIFLGYLVLNEIERPFLNPKQVITLTASDNLGLLKERKLVTSTDENPKGKFRIGEIISMCLNRTGLSLPFKVVHNVKPGTGSTTIDFANFSNAGSLGTIFFPLTQYEQFYVDQRLQATCTGANNGTVFTVTANNGGLNINVTPLPVNQSGVTDLVLTDLATGHIYDTMYLDALTFESKVGECEDCYTVLTKILDKECRLFQYRGEWWIVRTDEYNTGLLYMADYDADGTYNTTDSGNHYLKEIGPGGDAHWIERSQLVEYGRPHKFAQHTFRIESPAEIPCNINFERGDLLTTVSATEKTYELDCWALREGAPGFYGTVDGTTATIHRIFNANDYEIERYVVLTPRTSFETSSINDITYIESEAIPIEIKDKFSASVQWRLNLGIASGTNGSARLFRCVLNGDDGSWWILGEATTGDGNHIWYNTSGWTVNTAKGVVSLDFNTINEEELQSITWNAAPAPVTGKLYLWLNQFNQVNSSNDDKEIWYSGLTFEYIPYINAAYRKFTGQVSKAERVDTGYSANIDEDVSISDSPKPILKGGMFSYYSSVYKLQNIFWSSQQWGLSEPNNADYFQPYEYHRVNAVYNQYYKGIRFFSGQLRKLGPDWPDLLHKYELIETDYDTNNRKFILLSFEQDWKSGKWNGEFSQVYDSDGRTFPPFTFKYTTD